MALRPVFSRDYRGGLQFIIRYGDTFLESYDFSGKTIILFATSGGSGFGKTVDNLKCSVSDSTVIKEGKLLNGRPSVSELQQWVESLGV